MLTVQQAALMDFLRRLKCLKVAQAHWFLNVKYGCTLPRREQCLRQLRYLNRIRFEGEYLYPAGGGPDKSLQPDVEIMLQIAGRRVPEFSVGHGGIDSLTFYFEGKKELYRIIPVVKSEERRLGLRLGAEAVPEDTVLIFRLEGREQAALLPFVRPADACQS